MSTEEQKQQQPDAARPPKVKGKVWSSLQLQSTACLLSKGFQSSDLLSRSTKKTSLGTTKELITGLSQLSQKKIIQQAFWKKAPLQSCSQSIGVSFAKHHI